MKLNNITIIVDLNGYQSDRKCDEIMPIHDLATVFKGFGFRMIFINGHSRDEFVEAWHASAGVCTAILAHTTKAGGSSLLPPEGLSIPCPTLANGRTTITTPSTALSQPWHTRVLDWALYQRLVQEQLTLSKDASTLRLWHAHVAATFARTSGVALVL